MIRDEQFDKGLALRRAMFGPPGSDNQIDTVTEYNDKLQEFVTRQCFGDIWQRGELGLQERSMITIAMLIAMGRSHETGIHIRGGLANGLAPEKIREIVLQSILYAGLPAAMEGHRILAEVLTERAAAADNAAADSETTDADVPSTEGQEAAE